MSVQIKEYDDVQVPRGRKEEQFSQYCDFRFVPSTIDPDVVFAVRILKPAKPGYLLAKTHGWHMSIKPFERLDRPCSDYLVVEVDMRGRAYSTGSADCNGYELYDVYDAICFARREYRDFLCASETVYFESGSGGGGNALALAGKFPDLFSAVNALSPVSDYFEWYMQDRIGEFRDEMDIWIGADPIRNKCKYDSRSGVTVLPNVLTNILLCHGTKDARVPYCHSERYIEAAMQYELQSSITLYTLQNVGNREHFGNINDQQALELRRLCQQHLSDHTTPPSLKEKGSLIVCGYLVTKPFSIFLNSIDSIRKIAYDLANRTIEIEHGTADCTIIWHS